MDKICLELICEIPGMLYTKVYLSRYTYFLSDVDNTANLAYTYKSVSAVNSINSVYMTQAPCLRLYDINPAETVELYFNTWEDGLKVIKEIEGFDEEIKFYEKITPADIDEYRAMKILNGEGTAVSNNLIRKVLIQHVQRVNFPNK